jgi:hypothetical protein
MTTYSFNNNTTTGSVSVPIFSTNITKLMITSTSYVITAFNFLDPFNTSGTFNESSFSHFIYSCYFLNTSLSDNFSFFIESYITIKAFEFLFNISGYLVYIITKIAFKQKFGFEIIFLIQF